MEFNLKINLAEKIMAHFGDGSSFGVSISYIDETQPLRTCGALGLLPACNEMLVMNGDIVPHKDFRAMFNFHRQQSAKMTVGSRRYDLRVPYGVLE